MSAYPSESVLSQDDVTDPFLEYLREPGPQPLSRFIVAYTETVTRLVRRVVRCPEASRDVVQEVFLHLASPTRRAEDVPHPRAYVLRTALNLARNYLRDERVRADHEEEAGKLKPMVSPSADEEIAVREAVERLYRNIDSLPEPLRVAIHLRAVDGLSYRESALVTGVSVGIVGIQKARQKLSELSGGRELAVAWANLELARKQAWFPAATDGLSRAALARLKKVAKPTRSMIAPAAIVAVVTVAALGVSTPWLREGLQEVSRRDEVATALGERRGVPVSNAVPSVATSERPEKPMAPVVAGAETEMSGVRGTDPEAERPEKSRTRQSEGGDAVKGKTLLASAVVAVGMAAAVGGADTGDVDGDGRLTIARGKPSRTGCRANRGPRTYRGGWI